MSRIFLCKTYSREHCLTQWASTREELTLEIPRCHQVNIALFSSSQLPSLTPIVFILAVGLIFLYSSRLVLSSHGGSRRRGQNLISSQLHKTRGQNLLNLKKKEKWQSHRGTVIGLAWVEFSSLLQSLAREIETYDWPGSGHMSKPDSCKSHVDWGLEKEGPIPKGKDAKLG